MLEFDIETPSDVVPVKMKDKPSEITLLEIVNLDILINNKMPLHLKELKKDDEIDWSPLQWSEYYVFMAEVVSQLCDKSLNDIIHLKKGSLIEPEEGANICALYKHTMNNLVNYKAVEMQEFEFKGMTFRVPQKLMLNYGQQMYAPNISTIEAVEALQLQHVYESAKDEMEDYRYHTDIGIMAAICRRVDDGVVEQMPLDMNARREFMNQRINLFSNITMDLALNVRFFLTSLNVNCMRMIEHLLSLKVTQKVFSKPKPKVS